MNYCDIIDNNVNIIEKLYKYIGDKYKDDNDEYTYEYCSNSKYPHICLIKYRIAFSKNVDICISEHSIDIFTRHFNQTIDNTIKNEVEIFFKYQNRKNIIDELL